MEPKSINRPSRWNSVYLIFLRYVIYTVLIFAFGTILPTLAEKGDIRLFKEGGLFEWCQFMILTLLCIIFLLAGCNIKRRRELLFVLAMISGMAMIRELDSLLDDIIPVIGWKLPMTVLVAWGIFYVFDKREVLPDQIRECIRKRSFAILWAGFVFAVPMAQLIGHGDFLRSILGDDYTRNYKRIVEETGEMGGYLMILIGAVECILQEKFGGQHDTYQDQG